MPNKCHISTDTRLNALFRMLDADSAPSRINSQYYKNTPMSEKLANLGKLAEPLAIFLAEMDKKLDIILGQLQKENILEIFPHKGIIHSLTTHKALLKCHEALAPGDCLEMVLMLQEFPMQAIACFASITGVEHGTNGQMLYQAQFNDMDHETEEAIIQFLFQEERRRIRSIKNM